MTDMRIKTKASLSVSKRIEKKQFSENLIQAAAVYFLLMAVFSAYFSVFHMKISVLEMSIALGISALFLLLIMGNQKQRRKIYLAGCVFFAGAGFIMGKQLYGGLASFLNKFIELYNQYYANPKQTIIAESTEYSSRIALFFMGVILGFVLYIILDKKKGLLFAILIIMLPIIISAVVGKMPLTATWWLMIAATCFYLSVYRQNRATLSVKGLTCLSGLIVGIIVLSTAVQSMIIDYKNLHLENYNKIRAELLDAQEASLGDWKDNISDMMNPKQEFAGGVSKGKLSKNASVNPTGEVAMEIVMTQQPTDKIYLKAYVGSEYTGDSWREISAGDLSEILPRIGGATKRRELLNEPFRRVAESDYDEFLGDLEVPQMTIKLVNASREFGYAPYCAEITDKYDVQKDSYIKGNATKTRKYSFYPLSFEGDGYQNYLLGYVYQNVTTSPAYDSYGFSEFFGLELGEASELWIDYQEFVKAAYTDNYKELPKLREFCDSIDQYNIEAELLNYFGAECYYSKNPGEMPAELDFAEGFMFGRQVGFCVHFATAATLVYQMCGQPARYVEGYAISPSAFSRYEDGTYRATVTDENAHAWCEVFDQELGWVAKEFTPASGQVFNSYEGNDNTLTEDDWMNENPDEDMSENIPQDSDENPDNPQAGENTGDNFGGNGESGGLFPGASENNDKSTSNNDIWKMAKQLLWKVLIFAIVNTLMFIVVIVQQKIRRAKRMKSFRQKKENRGVLSIYNAIIELCVISGFQTENENERERIKEIAAQFPQITTAEWEQLYMWAEKAAFSNEKLSGEVQKEMYRLYKRFRNEILKQLSFKKKIFVVYIKAI